MDWGESEMGDIKIFDEQKVVKINMKKIILGRNL